MPADKVCAECGATLPQSALGARCPKCLLSLALNSGGEAPEFESDAEASDASPQSEFPNPQSALLTVHRFGDYELLEQIARGGMGVVYKARQVKLNRMVALKMILSGQFASKQEVLRFRSEAEAAANLRHPNIVAIYETGESEAQHYFSMEYVQGRNLAEIVRDGPLPAQRAARYAQIIAEAIEYAHQQGTLHRDLKPSNVLIDADDQPRITDFGLAKRVRGDFGLTVTGQVLGSPNFMPPEQTGAKHAKVGPASDVYGIGAILYHLLTGRPPFQAEAIEDVLIQLRETEPVAPRLLNHSVPCDLETICLKCLQKEPGKRYPTAQALAEELGRFLHDEPILARPATALERAWRWCRRKPVIAGLIATTIALMLVVAIGSPIVVFRINRERQVLRQNLYAADMSVAQQALQENDLGRAFNLLQKHIPKAGEEDLRGFEWRLLWKGCQGDQLTILDAHKSGVGPVAFSADWSIMATAGFLEDTTVKIWDVPTRKLLVTLPTQNYRAPGNLFFSPNGKTLAGKMPFASPPQTILWSTTNWREVGRLTNAVAEAFLDDGKTLATRPALRDNRFEFWNTETWQVRSRLETGAPTAGPAAYSKDARWLALDTPSGSGGRKVGLWDLPSRSKVADFGGEIETRFAIMLLVFSPQGGFLAAGTHEGHVRIWDVPTRQVLGDFQAHDAAVEGIRFSPDGTRFATCSDDQLVRLWDTGTRTNIATYKGHRSIVWQVAFSPDGQTLASSSRDGTIRFWHGKPQPEQMHWPGNGYALGFSADGRSLILLDAEQNVLLCDTATGQVKSTRPLPAQAINQAVSFDGLRLAVGLANGTTQVWDLSTDQLAETLEGDASAKKTFAFSRNSRFLGVADWKSGGANSSGSVRVFDLKTRGTNMLRIEASRMGGFPALALSPDGKILAAGSTLNHAKLWDVRTHQELATLIGPRTDIFDLAFSPDGKWVAGCAREDTAWIWEVPSGKCFATFKGRSAFVVRLAFAPDGKTLITNASDGRVEFWNIATGRVLVTRTAPERVLTAALYSPDGNVLALANSDRSTPRPFVQVLQPGTLAQIDAGMAKAKEQ